ncbi:telomere-binding protein CDC13 SCDLUD_002992 [Saccharomycodes ludwigii]|uniref:telomere-binding protein CDC13 n=1 Tax=Saccharomycodes ludwigii TaxID=36035 RepID=UPI001E88FA0C|nr:hypothetical protein SCDLUD_002992 [Saccharomycodes ludwigii]KAH3901496.1 hypothetical protein SCDLUD_002992 [Saccharomycodes ludwigii]
MIIKKEKEIIGLDVDPKRLYISKPTDLQSFASDTPNFNTLHISFVAVLKSIKFISGKNTILTFGTFDNLENDKSQYTCFVSNTESNSLSINLINILKEVYDITFPDIGINTTFYKQNIYLEHLCFLRCQADFTVESSKCVIYLVNFKPILVVRLDDIQEKQTYARIFKNLVRMDQDIKCDFKFVKLYNFDERMNCYREKVLSVNLKNSLASLQRRQEEQKQLETSTPPFVPNNNLLFVPNNLESQQFDSQYTQTRNAESLKREFSDISDSGLLYSSSSEELQCKQRRCAIDNMGAEGENSSLKAVFGEYTYEKAFNKIDDEVKLYHSLFRRNFISLGVQTTEKAVSTTATTNATSSVEIVPLTPSLASDAALKPALSIHSSEQTKKCDSNFTNNTNVANTSNSTVGKKYRDHLYFKSSNNHANATLQTTTTLDACYVPETSVISCDIGETFKLRGTIVGVLPNPYFSSNITTLDELILLVKPVFSKVRGYSSLLYNVDVIQVTILDVSKFFSLIGTKLESHEGAIDYSVVLKTLLNKLTTGDLYDINITKCMETFEEGYNTYMWVLNLDHRFLEIAPTVFKNERRPFRKKLVLEVKDIDTKNCHSASVFGFLVGVENMNSRYYLYFTDFTSHKMLDYPYINYDFMFQENRPIPRNELFRLVVYPDKFRAFDRRVKCCTGVPFTSMLNGKGEGNISRMGLICRFDMRIKEYNGCLEGTADDIWIIANESVVHNEDKRRVIELQRKLLKSIPPSVVMEQFNVIRQIMPIVWDPDSKGYNVADVKIVTKKMDSSPKNSIDATDTGNSNDNANKEYRHQSILTTDFSLLHGKVFFDISKKRPYLLGKEIKTISQLNRYTYIDEKTCFKVTGKFVSYNKDRNVSLKFHMIDSNYGRDEGKKDNTLIDPKNMLSVEIWGEDNLKYFFEGCRITSLDNLLGKEVSIYVVRTQISVGSHDHPANILIWAPVKQTLRELLMSVS